MYSKKIVLCMALLATLSPHTSAGPRKSPPPAQIAIQPAVTTNPTTAQDTTGTAQGATNPTTAQDTTGTAQGATNPTVGQDTTGTAQGATNPAKTHSPSSSIKAEDAIAKNIENLKVLLNKEPWSDDQCKEITSTINQSRDIIMNELFEMIEKEKVQKSTSQKIEDPASLANLQRIHALMNSMVPHIHTMLKTKSKNEIVVDWLANTTETAQQINARKNCQKNEGEAKNAGTRFLNVHELVQLRLNAPVDEKLADKTVPNQAKSSNTPDALPPAKTIVRSGDNNP